MFTSLEVFSANSVLLEAAAAGTTPTFTFIPEGSEVTRPVTMFLRAEYDAGEEAVRRNVSEGDRNRGRRGWRARGSGVSMQLDMFLLLLVSVAAKHRHNTLKNSAEIRNKKPRPYPLHLFFIYSVSSLLRNCLHQVFLNRWEHSARSHIKVKYRCSWCRGLLRVTYSSSLQASRVFFRFAFSFGFAAHSLSGFVSVFQKWQADVSMLFHSYKCWNELHPPLHDMKVSS